MHTAVMQPEFKVTAMRKSKSPPLVALSLMASGGIVVTAATMFLIAQGETIRWNQWGAVLYAVFGICYSSYKMMQPR
jgi:drug/metabolite transporter (DMT)-like permease